MLIFSSKSRVGSLVCECAGLSGMVASRLSTSDLRSPVLHWGSFLYFLHLQSGKAGERVFAMNLTSLLSKSSCTLCAWRRSLVEKWEQVTEGGEEVQRHSEENLPCSDDLEASLQWRSSWGLHTAHSSPQRKVAQPQVSVCKSRLRIS